jgi:serine/threonine protein kinase
MSATGSTIGFDRALHQALPHPLAHAYRKAYNSSSPKDLHDNACLFGLCLLRFLAAAGLAMLRDLQVVLEREEAELLAKLDRPAEGDWHRALLRSVERCRERKPAANSPAELLEVYLHGKREASRSALPESLGQLLSHVEKKPVVRKVATADDFLLTLIRYRNDTMGHGAVLPEEINQANGEAVLRAITELAREQPLGADWDLKYVARSMLTPTAVECQLIHLMGPDWLRDAPISYPRGYPAPAAGHVVLLPRHAGLLHLDLHPLVVFHADRVHFFNGLRGKAPGYLDYETAQKVSIANLATDYAEWKQFFGSAATGSETSKVPAQDDVAPPLAPSPAPSSRFRFDRRLGRGGMGEVWCGYDEMLKRQVAIKRIRPEVVGRADMDRRFLQEARDAARLAHPNIVPILSVDSDVHGPFLVLEYVEGGSLRQALDRGPLQLPVALAYLRQMLQALQHAHEHGLIHRDVKPENILLSKAGVPKLGDFGLAWLVEEQEDGEPRLEAPGEGTSKYMAPELRDRHEPPSPKSDLFALGMTFAEMLTGRPPGRMSESKTPSSVLPLLRKLTHADPNLRYDTAAAALHDCLELERALELAGRTEEETAARIRQTARQAFQLLADNRLIDAQAGFERILAEDPDSPQGLTGLLLQHVLAGDMEQSAARYRALAERGVDDPLFVRFRDFIQAIPNPAAVHITPQALPFSYRTADLRQGRFVKELTELAGDTVNLGDVGEVLVELAQRPPGRAVRHEAPDKGQHLLQFELDRVRVNALFRFRIKSRSLFAGARLLAADLTLTIHAESFATYRLVRYLASNLMTRYGRPPSDWARPAAAEHFGLDLERERTARNLLTCDVRALIQTALH